MKTLSDAELTALHDNGYVVIRDLVTGAELQHCQEETQRLISEISVGGYAKRWYVDHKDAAPHSLRHLHANLNSFSLRLLAHPTIGDALARTIGSDFLPYAESFDFVPPGLTVNGIRSHNDSPVSETKRAFRLEVFLDDLSLDNSRIEMIRGSHVWDARRREMVGESGESVDALRVVAGDAVFFSANTVTRMSFAPTEGLRRFITLDFCSYQEARSRDGVNKEALLRRISLYQYARHQREIAPYADDQQVFDYAPPEGLPVWTPGEPVDLFADVFAVEA